MLPAGLYVSYVLLVMPFLLNYCSLEVKWGRRGICRMQVKESFNGSLQILGAGFIYQITPVPMHTGELLPHTGWG